MDDLKNTVKSSSGLTYRKHHRSIDGAKEQKKLTIFVQVCEALGGAQRDGEPRRPVHHRHVLPCTHHAFVSEFRVVSSARV